jgi:hypothetical protein
MVIDSELDAITKRTRSSTVHAVRDTELARMPLTLFNAISVRCVLRCALVLLSPRPPPVSD